MHSFTLLSKVIYLVKLLICSSLYFYIIVDIHICLRIFFAVLISQKTGLAGSLSVYK